MSGEHTHRFDPILRRQGGFEWLVGHEPCSCGMTRTEWMCAERPRLTVAMMMAARGPRSGWAAWVRKP